LFWPSALATSAKSGATTHKTQLRQVSNFRM
jgi:hypothetical protein